MTRKSLAAVVVLGALCLALASCHLLSGPERIAPADPKAAARWWAERVEAAPAEFLAVYVEAAEVHRGWGTAATYVELRGGHSMVGKVGEEFRLPCPPPAEVLVKMREKARGAEPGDHLLTAEDCRGCTPAEAVQIWRGAAQKLNQRQQGE